VTVGILKKVFVVSFVPLSHAYEAGSSSAYRAPGELAGRAGYIVV